MILTYDTSFEGLLTALYEVEEYTYTLADIQEESKYQPQLFVPVHQVITNKTKAVHLLEKVEKHLGKNGSRTLFLLYLSEDERKDRLALHLFNYMRRCPNENILMDFSDERILNIQQIVKKVHRECHRMKAFVRFAQLEDDTYFARIEPDFNVLPLILSHFSGRYQDQKWIIYDQKRRYGILYDLTSTQYWTPSKEQVDGLEAPDLPLAEKESWYQGFWKAYFKKTNIKERRNDALHLRHIPKRYWKHLIEKKDEI